jgi:hypothetical protein
MMQQVMDMTREEAPFYSIDLTRVSTSKHLRGTETLTTAD